MTRKCFYSFHYEPDNWRASQIREMGSLEGNRPATDNDWEEVKKGGGTTPSPLGSKASWTIGAAP